jgi:hypothetical protein
MQRTLSPSALVPHGFVVGAAVSHDTGMLITVRAVTKTNACPGCGAVSQRIHSRLSKAAG